MSKNTTFRDQTFSISSRKKKSIFPANEVSKLDTWHVFGSKLSLWLRSFFSYGIPPPFRLSSPSPVLLAGPHLPPTVQTPLLASLLLPVIYFSMLRPAWPGLIQEPMRVPY